MTRRGPALALLLAVGLCAAPAAGQGLDVSVASATLDDRGQHLVLDVRIDNTTDAEVYVLLSEVLVFGPDLPEARCPAGSTVLAGPPGLQLRIEEGDRRGGPCDLEPRSPGPQWRQGILRLEAGQEVTALVAVGGPALLDDLTRVRFGVSWASPTELPRRLARRAYGAEGVFMAARPATGPPGGGARIARLFPNRATSDGAPLHRR